MIAELAKEIFLHFKPYQSKDGKNWQKGHCGVPWKVFLVSEEFKVKLCYIFLLSCRKLNRNLARIANSRNNRGCLLPSLPTSTSHYAQEAESVVWRCLAERPEQMRHVRHPEQSSWRHHRRNEAATTDSWRKVQTEWNSAKTKTLSRESRAVRTSRACAPRGSTTRSTNCIGRVWEPYCKRCGDKTNVPSACSHE